MEPDSPRGPNSIPPIGRADSADAAGHRGALREASGSLALQYLCLSFVFVLCF